MVAILALLFVYGLQRPFDFAPLVIIATEDINTLGPSMEAQNISLVNEPNILADSILGYFAMVWPAHVLLQHPLLIDQQGGSLGIVGANPSNELCITCSGSGEVLPSLEN